MKSVTHFLFVAIFCMWPKNLDARYLLVEVNAEAEVNKKASAMKHEVEDGNKSYDFKKLILDCTNKMSNVLAIYYFHFH